MISPKQLQANRTNARRSTGPKSCAGKARSARNALRHGLAVPVWSDAKLSADAEALAWEIAGAGAATEVLALAREIAAAQIELVRAQQARLQVLTAAQSVADGVPPSDVTVPSDLPSIIVAIDRYERRALSRRKTAIRGLSTAKNNNHKLLLTAVFGRTKPTCSEP